MSYKYFCGACGCRFESDIPEIRPNGLHNSIDCPTCGCYDTYPDTPEGARQSLRDLNEYEANLLKWEDLP